MELLLDYGFDIVLMAKDLPTTDDLTQQDAIELLSRLLQSDRQEYQWLKNYHDAANPLKGRLTIRSSGSTTPATDLNKLTPEGDIIFRIFKGGGSHYGTYPASMNVDAFYIFMVKEPLQVALVMEAGISREQAERGHIVFQYKEAKSAGKRIDALLKHGAYFDVEQGKTNKDILQHNIAIAIEAAA